MSDDRRVSGSSSGSEYSDEVKIYGNDKYQLGDEVIIRQSKKKDDKKKIIMFRGRIVGFDYKKCKKPMWGSKESRNDFKEKYYCIELKDYRTNADNFETVHNIPGSETNRLSWVHKDSVYDYFNDKNNNDTNEKDFIGSTDEVIYKNTMQKIKEQRMKMSPPPEQFRSLEDQIEGLQFKMEGGRRKRKKRRKRTKKRGRKTRKKKREMRKTKKLPNGKDDIWRSNG